MVAWTGMEMYENGWESDLRCVRIFGAHFSSFRPSLESGDMS